MAEENKVQDTEQVEQNTQDEPVTIDSLMAEMAKLKAENAKNKTALDKALHNNGELTKQPRAKMTASEQEAEAKREAEEAQANRIKELETFKRTAEARERYADTIGMTPDLAREAAEAEVSGNMDALAAVYKKHQEQAMKALEAEWYKNRPMPETGRGEGKAEEDPFLAGFKQG